MTFKEDVPVPRQDGTHAILDPEDLFIDYSLPTTERSWLVITVAGEVQATNAKQLEDAIELALLRYSRIALDLREVPLCDPEGVVTLLKIRSRAGHDGQKIRFVNLSDSVRRVFEMSGVADILAEQL